MFKLELNQNKRGGNYTKKPRDGEHSRKFAKKMLGTIENFLSKDTIGNVEEINNLNLFSILDLLDSNNFFHILRLISHEFKLYGDFFDKCVKSS